MSDQASDHRGDRLLRGRHHHGDEGVPAHLPSREAQAGRRRGRCLPSLRPARHARQAEGGGSQGNKHFSHFGPEANLIEELETLFRSYGKTGTGKIRHYLHDADEAGPYQQDPGTFTPWVDLPENTDLLFYEGLHGGYADEQHNIAAAVDLLVGVVPIINLEWIQKLHRDQNMRGYSQEAVVDTILRRMPDYINHLCPQFSRTHVNFQRVPTVDTSNPFIARDIPTADESMLVIRFADPERHRLPVPAEHAARLDDDPAEQHRLPGWQNGARDADDLHADDPASDGQEAPRLTPAPPLT